MWLLFTSLAHLPPEKLPVVHALRRAEAARRSLPGEVRGSHAQAWNEASIDERAKDGAQDLHAHLQSRGLDHVPHTIAPVVKGHKLPCSNHLHNSHGDMACMRGLTETVQLVICNW